MVGNSVGSNLKDTNGQSIYVYILWTITLAIILEDLFISIHAPPPPP